MEDCVQIHTSILGWGTASTVRKWSEVAATMTAVTARRFCRAGP